jgi:hypothetical protein
MRADVGLGVCRVVVRAIAALMLLAGSPSRAADLDGNKLWTWCGSENVVERALCAGYISGALGGMTFIMNDPGAPKAFCLPPNLVGDQIHDVVKKALADYPAARSAPAPWLIAKAIHDAWPCPDKKS